MLGFDEVLGSGSQSAIIPYTALFGLLVNGPYYLAAHTGRWLRGQALLRMCLDIVLITLGLYGAGGLAGAPFIGVYAIVAVYAGISFSSHAALLATWMATASYLVVAALQHAAWLPAPAVETSSPWLVVFFNLLVLNIVGGLTMLLARAYRRSLGRAREGEERLRATTETATDAIISSDSKGHMTSLNHAAQVMFGYAREEALGRPVTLLMPEAYRAEHLRGIERLESGGESRLIGRTVEVRGLTKRGTEFPLELSLSAWSVGSERFFTAIIRDLTDRQMLEAQLRQAQKMEAIGRLAGGIVHDFNNFLTVIMARATLLQQRHLVDETARNDIELIEQAGRKAAELTRQLLAFSRQQVLEAKVLDLNAVITEIEPILRRLLGEDIELVIGRGSALGVVKADLSQIEQVIMNLAVNASDAMPKGGRLTIETANASLDGTGLQPPGGLPAGAYAVLSVSDTGTGMDTDTLSHIFEPFFTTKEPGKGTGLGLATVYGIVTQSGGHVTVATERGHGTTFKIYLPQTEQPVGVAIL
jgi:PAS domain S-box-containing protein